jgi:methyl coenzyme M reductase alpha subunit
MESFFGIDPSSPSFYSNMPTNTVFGSSTGATTPKGMDPATLALGLGSSVIGGIGSAIAGDQAAAAAERAAKQKAKEDIAGQFAGFGLDYLTQRYNTGVGAAANRMNTLKDATESTAFEAYNPAAQNLRSNERFGRVQDYAARLSASMPGYVSPLNLFG